MKKIILGAVVAATMIGGFAATADAKVRIYLGVPYYNYQVGPGYLYDDDYGWHHPRYHRRNHFYTYNQYDDYNQYDNGQYLYHPKKKKHRRHNWQ
jgi:hypothetical protein